MLRPRHGLSGLIFIVRNKSRRDEFLLSFNGKCCKVLHQYCIGWLARAIAVAISGSVVNGSMTREYSTRQLLPSLILLLLGCMLFTGCSKAGASPDQPIAFSHRIHVENQIDCSYCHDYYEDYDVAGMPPVATCVDCHSLMFEEEPTADLEKIFEFADAGTEIPWVRLYELPKYTHFSHKWHVRAELECQTCHGEIGTSDRAVQHMVYNMDWCLTCHEEQAASVDCVTCHK